MPHHDHAIDISGPTITTGRMRLRPWTEADAEPALEVFGSDEVARWLAPAMTSGPGRRRRCGTCSGAGRRSTGHRTADRALGDRAHRHRAG